MTSAQGSEYDGKLIARTVLLVLGAVGAGILSVAAIVISVFLTSGGPGWASGILTGGCFVLIASPPILFGILSFESGEDRRYIRRWTWGSAVLQLVAIVGVVIGGIVSSLPLWFPILVIALGVAFELTALLLARLVRPTAVAPWPSVLTEWIPYPQRSNLVLVWIVSVVGVVVLGLAVLDIPSWNWGSRGRAEFSGFLIFGCVIGVVVCAIKVIPMANNIRNSIGGHNAHRRFIVRAVVGSKPVELDVLQRELARRYAAVVVAFQPWQLAMFGFLFVELLSLEFSSAYGPDSPGLGFAIVVAVAGIVRFSTLAVQFVGGRRFLALNGQPSNTPLATA
jgi:MFS family permease